MARRITSILGNREKSAEDEIMEDSPEESLEIAPDEAPEETPAETPGEKLEESPKKISEGILESPEESQDPNLNLDLLYDAPVLEMDMMEVMAIDPELWRLYGESL
jgi:hypothetical protein